MIERAREILESYDVPKLSKIGISRIGKHFGTSHTVVTYFPLEALEDISQDEVIRATRTSEPINLYFHVPFCISKCLYCSYVSEPKTKGERIQAYFSALTQEMHRYGHLLSERPVSSFYIGGGTPTAISLQQLERLIDFIHTTFNVDENTFRCVESNPVTLTGTRGQEKLEMLVEKGVQRISMGVQTFNDNLLKSVARGYSKEKTIRSVIADAKSRFKVINIDMMQDLPNQTLKDIKSDLEVIAELMPESVTWYTMRLGPGCRLHGKVKINEESSLITKIMIMERLREFRLFTNFWR